ncbi:MAG: BglG family transcription antiterminator, partial [Bacillaceae bacterium]|nr:BglG family transcription antiterminator [Bacillaceae bacterium]
MILDERCTQLVTSLCNADDYISIDSLTNQLGISKRTIYYDVQKINDWLAERKLAPVKKKHGKGYYLEKEVKDKVPLLINKLEKFQYYYSQGERLMLMAVELLTKKNSLFLEDFMEMTQVSRATASSDLKEVKKQFLQHQINVSFSRNDGYIVKGQEEQKRQLLVYYLIEILTNKNQLKHWFDQIKLPFRENVIGTESVSLQLQQVMPIIAQCEKELSIELTDEMVHLLALKLLVLVHRLVLGNRIKVDHDAHDVIVNTKEYQAALNIAEKLHQMYHIQIPDPEVCFITMNLLGSKVNYSDIELKQDKEMKRLRATVKKIVQDFQNYACILFHDVTKLEETLFLHLKPAYYRMKYNVSAIDIHTENVMREFPEIFQLTKKSLSSLEVLLGATIKDSETAYITMHFGGWLQREGKRLIKRKTALIVCENGLGTSNILWGQLENIVSTIDIVGCVSQRQYEQKDFKVDLVFATSEVRTDSHPVLIVNPILTDKDKEAVLSFVNNLASVHRKSTSPTLSKILSVVKKHATVLNERDLSQELAMILNIEQRTQKPREEKPVLKDLLTTETIQYKDKVSNWREAIIIAAEPLLKLGSISESYIEAMITNIDNLGPYIVIAPDIALPHARPEEGVFKIGMSLLKLKNRVAFSDQEKHQVRLVFVLAAIDNERHF